MPTAWNLIPPRFEDGRHLAVSAGLERRGFALRTDWRGERPGAGDVLCTWNLHVPLARRAHATFRAAGCPTLVFEEAYTRRLVRETHFAVAVNGHNGSGRWPAGDGSRWARLGIEAKPWRRDGDRILVCAARGMGSPEMAEPRPWADEVSCRLSRVTARPVLVRRHPGKRYGDRPLATDLAGAWAVVVWGSNCATQALIEGVPVFLEGPHHVLEGACQRGLADIDDPAYPERRPALDRMAWAQWGIDEIRHGDPFRHLLRGPRESESAAAL